MIHPEERIRVAACGCHYDVVTGISTHLCETHDWGRSPRGAKRRAMRQKGLRDAEGAREGTR
jgi:hypothetical protein